MATWTRRDVMRAAVAASAVAAAPVGLGAETHGAETVWARDVAGSSTSLRERLLMDAGWRFALGSAADPAKDFGFGRPADTGLFAKSGEVGGPAGHGSHAFDDSAWKAVDLPHDWAVDLPFVPNEHTVPHGGKPLGRTFPETSVGWYRKTFKVGKEDLGKRIAVEFDGVIREAMVFLNGHLLAQHSSGYAPFEVDVTDFLNYGADNWLVLRVDATLNEGWFYEGAGIYRHVWLRKTAAVHIAKWGNFVQARLEKGIAGPAALKVSTEVVNESRAVAACGVSAVVKDAKGTQVATVRSKGLTLAAGGTATLEMECVVSRPELWSVEEPRLYLLETVLIVDGKTMDAEATPFGIRTVRFDADKGFFLNERHVKIKGTCNHQDHAGLGAALPDAMQYYRVGLLKEMGSNAYRTSHNCPTSELMDACDRLGMMVLDETRTFSSSADGLRELETLVKRDRNRPSVIMWSIGNEEPQQGTERGARIGQTMKDAILRLDPTRPVTEAMNHGFGGGISNVVDVQGFNYRISEIEPYRKTHPKQPLIGTETASTVSTRGIYTNDPSRGFVRAYDTEKPSWADLAEDWWKFFDEREWLAGGFVWTGFDYRGEPTPYVLPCISSHFGLMDTCGFPKDNYFYYKTWWRAEPALHLFPHWNWGVAEGTEVEVWCYSNLESVELWLNGKSLGSQSVEKNGHLVWKVPYATGRIEARASRGGKVVLTESRETTGAAAGLRLVADRSSIKADGKDLAVVRVEVVDPAGRVVPTADNLVRFKVEGSSKIIGVGNGNPSSLEPDHAEQRSAFNGLAMAILQAPKTTGAIVLKASADGLTAAEVRIDCT